MPNTISKTWILTYCNLTKPLLSLSNHAGTDCEQDARGQDIRGKCIQPMLWTNFFAGQEGELLQDHCHWSRSKVRCQWLVQFSGLCAGFGCDDAGQPAEEMRAIEALCCLLGRHQEAHHLCSSLRLHIGPGEIRTYLPFMCVVFFIIYLFINLIFLSES